MGCFFSRRVENDNQIHDMSPVRHLPVIFVNGVPGAGNQTVAEAIAAITGYTTIRPGELVRAEADRDTARGRLVADRLRSQDVVPEQITVDVIKESMLTHQDAKGFILVGFPRSPKMSSIFSRQVKSPEKIVVLEVDDEVAATRLQSKLSELGKPEADMDAVRQIVREAASRVKSVHKRFGGHVVTLNSSDNPNAMAVTLKEVLSDMMEADHKESEANPSVTFPDDQPDIHITPDKPEQAVEEIS